MRVCHIIQSLDPVHGGPTAVSARLSSAICSNGHEVTLIGGVSPGRRSIAESALRAVPGIDRVDVRLLDLRDSISDRILGTAIVKSFDASGQFDVVHFHGTWEPTFVRIAAMCRRKKIPYVIRPAGMLDFWSLEQKAWKKKLALNVTHRSFIRGAAAIQALNPHEKSAIEALGLDVRIEVIPNGVFLEEVELPTQEDEFRDAFPLLGKDRFILFMSRLHFKKGLDILAEAWKSVSELHSDVKLVVAGPEEDDSIEDFRRRLAGHAGAARVIESGPIYGKVKVAALRECALFVLPSRQEGFSMAITEALALGAPVVITEECHFPEVGVEGAGIVTKLDATEVARAMDLLLASDEAVARCSRAARALIRSRYTWPAIASSVVRMYESFGASRRSAAA